MKVAYASRIGIEACILRARDSLYWPRMTTEEYIAECGICLTHRDAQSKEQLLQHEIVARSVIQGGCWSLRAERMYPLSHRCLLQQLYRGCTYHDSYFAQHHNEAERSLCQVRHTRDIIVTDNGPQFWSTESSFLQRPGVLSMCVITTSPVVKRLLQTRYKDSGQSEFVAL